LAAAALLLAAPAFSQTLMADISFPVQVATERVNAGQLLIAGETSGWELPPSKLEREYM
jgi:hypothetical protein